MVRDAKSKLEDVRQQQEIAKTRAIESEQSVNFRLKQAHGRLKGTRGTKAQQEDLKALLRERRGVRAEIARCMGQLVKIEQQRQAVDKIDFVNTYRSHTESINKIFKTLNIDSEHTETTLETHQDHMDQVEEINDIIMGDVHADDLNDELEEELQAVLEGRLLDECPPVPAFTGPRNHGSAGLLLTEDGAKANTHTPSNKQPAQKRHKKADVAEEPGLLDDLLASAETTGFDSADVLEFDGTGAVSRSGTPHAMPNVCAALLDELGA